MVLTWGEKVKWGSRVIPRTLGFWSRGRARFPKETTGWSLYSEVQFVKRVTPDLLMEIMSPFLSAHSAVTCGVGGEGTGRYSRFGVGGGCGEIVCIGGDLGIVVGEVADIKVKQRGGDD